MSNQQSYKLLLNVLLVFRYNICNIDLISSPCYQRSSTNQILVKKIYEINFCRKCQAHYSDIQEWKCQK